ncbi:hypothetical protein P8452_28039 [Trifolium repens]|nr:hypothetical protein P8452_28039 [Trifolium repens]
MIHIRFILLLCFLLHNFHVIICNNNTTDKDILLSFKLQVTDPNNALSSWKQDSSHCTWYGVNCSKVDQRVQSLTLSGLSLSGKLPSNLSNLTYLHSLDLSNNSFDGQIPNQFSHLSLLNVIKLPYNNLSGTLPPQLGQLHNLQILDFSVNNLTGKIPSSFGNLFSLKNLSMARNMFFGEIPSELGNLHNLSRLQLSQNNFTGEIPTSFYFNLSSLEFLSLTMNNLSGILPQKFGDYFPNLRTLTLATNRFEGVIPNSISNLSHLQIIDLANNRFHGPIPLFTNFKNLTYLVLSNNLLTSTTSLNFEFFESLRNSTQLEILKVNDNKLAGELPNSVAYLSSNLQEFCVANNELNGTIPKGIQKLQNLTSFSFEQNNFTGELLLELGTLKKLQRLLIYQNRLSGEIPDIFGNFTNLFILALGNNQFSGRIPTSIGQCESLTILDLEKNKLVGVIPMEIFQLYGLTALYLNGNSLNGSLPPVSNMRQLETMFVSDNKLSGNIPEIKANSLKTLLMERNKFSGSIPNSLGDLASLETLDLSSNNLTGEVPMKGVFMNLSQVDLNGKKKKRNILLPIILGIIGATVLFVSMIYLLWRLMSLKKKHKQEIRTLSSIPLKGMPQNITYDEDMVAHVADFGLARFLSQNPSEKHSSTLELKGSIGYIAPEYGLGGKASTSGDVYSFGILLLEIFIAKKPTDEMFKEGLNMNKFALDMDDKKLLKIVDQRLINQFEYSTQNFSSDCNSSSASVNNSYSDGIPDWMHKAEECIAASMRVGLSCISYHPKDRWTMREAVSKLRGIKQSILGL